MISLIKTIFFISQIPSFFQHLTDQLCRKEPCHGPMFSVSTINLNSDWDPDCLLAMSLSWYVFPEESLNPLCSVERCKSPCPLPDINPISSMMVEMCLFSSASPLSMFHWTCTKLKFQHHLFVQSRFVIHLWISLSSNHPQSMTASLQPTVTWFSSL